MSVARWAASLQAVRKVKHANRWCVAGMSHGSQATTPQRGRRQAHGNGASHPTAFVGPRSPVPDSVGTQGCASRTNSYGARQQGGHAVASRARHVGESTTAGSAPSKAAMVSDLQWILADVS